MATWDNVNERWNCTTDSDSGPSAAFEVKSGEVVIPEDGLNYEVARLELPTGRFALNSTGDVGPAVAGNDNIFGFCTLFGPGPSEIDSGTYGQPGESVALGGIVRLGAAGSVTVQCNAIDDDLAAAIFEIVAITVR